MKGIYRSESGARVLRERYEAALASWPVPAQRLVLPTPQGETFALACGPVNAPVVVLLHGAGANSAVWAPCVAELATRSRVVAVDLLGEPGLSAPVRPPLAADDHVRWLDAVFAELGCARVSLVGQSLGGWLALRYASERADRVDRVAVSCPVGVGRAKFGFLAEAALLNGLGRWGKRVSLRRTLGGALSRLPATRAEEVLEHLLLVSRHFRYRMEPVPMLDEAALRRLSMPVHVVIGQDDVMIDVADLRRRFARVGRASIEVLDGTGHFVPVSAAVDVDFVRGAGVGG